MPLFNFECKDCSTIFEEWVISNSRISEVRCPDCESDQLEKLLSRIAGTIGSSSSATSFSASSCAPGGT